MIRLKAHQHNNSSIKQAVWFCLLGGGILAMFISHWLMPVSQPIQTTLMPGWINSGQPAHKGFFRQTVNLSFRPTHAWVKVAGPDYELFVNGKSVGRNRYVVNVTVPFTHNVRDANQSLTRGTSIAMARAPSMQKRASQGWRMVQVYDITSYLVTGKNTIAVSVQADGINRFAITGAVHGESDSVTLSGRAQDWKVAFTSDRRNGLEWYSPYVDDSGWQAAASGGQIEEPQFTIAPSDVWTQKFEATAVTGPRLSDGVYFKTELPALTWQESHGPTYIRVASNWPYSVFVDDSLVSANQSSNVLVYDLTRHVGGQARTLYIRLQSPPETERLQAPWMKVDGQIGPYPLNTRSAWQSLYAFNTAWLEGQGDWRNVNSIELPDRPIPVRLVHRGERDLAWLAQLGMLGLVLSTLLLGLLRLMPGKAPLWSGMDIPAVRQRSGMVLWVPALLAIMAAELLRFRFQETDTLLWYLDPANQLGWFLLAPAVVLLTWITVRDVKPRLSFRHRLMLRLRSCPTEFWLLLITLCGLYLRIYDLQFEDLQADENVSWDAARGILKTGVPEAVSGVLYTRSPLYHYMLAGWLWLFGDNVYVARSFAAVFGAGTIILFYRLLLEISGKRYLALLGALLIAVDPWEIQVSRIIRFYQQMQFFSIWAALLFLKAFVWRQGKAYQNYFFVVVAAAVLSQEVYITVFPALGIAFLLFYKSFDWLLDRNILAGFVIVCLVTAVDIGIFTIVCLTAHVGVATTSASIMQLHLLDIINFVNTLGYGDNGANVLYTILALVGVWCWRRHPDPAITFLYVLVAMTLVTLTVLVLQVAARYGNSVYPFLIAIAVLTADKLVALAAQWLFDDQGPRLRNLANRWGALMGALVVVAFVVNLEPWKIPASYSLARTPEHETALTFVAQRMRPEDKVLSVYPMPAAILMGGIDYYLVGEVAFDELYQAPQGVIERWAGGVHVSKIDHLRKLFDHHDRVWLVIDEIEARKMSANMHDLIKNSCRVMMEFFGGTVYLWDKTAGIYHPVPDMGGHSDSY